MATVRSSPRAGGSSGDAGVAVRVAALEALCAVETAQLGSQAALQPALAALRGPDRGLCTELVYGVLRRQRSLDRWIAPDCDRGLVAMDAKVLTALRLGAYQLTEMSRIPPFAAVDATTEACKRGKGWHRGSVGFVHAVLRKLAARAHDQQRPDHDDLPPWLATRVADFATDLELDGAALATAFGQAAPVHVQILGPADQTAAAAENLLTAGVLRAPLQVPGAWLADGAVALQHRDYGKKFLVQDAASAAVVRWLNPQPGWRVLDLAAGRGVKAALLATLGAQVTAVDTAAEKLQSALELCAAVGAPLVQTVVADAGGVLPFADASFDAVLVDAPCTGLGTLRRRPEIRHRRRAADLVAMAAVQLRLAATAARLVRPGGVVMLATCSFAREEGPLWLQQVLRDHPLLARSEFAPQWAERLLDRNGDLRTHPLIEGMDAFFAARLHRQP